MVNTRFKRLVDRLTADIREGRLPPGTRLPTHRALASKEHIALATATRVYAELAAIGLVSGEAGRGTFVRETLLQRGLGIDQHAVADGVADLNFNYPALPGQDQQAGRSGRSIRTRSTMPPTIRAQPGWQRS